jgi:glycosyltransferase involved in cell wall biosynthesis
MVTDFFSNITLSICMITYNQGGFLKEAISGVLNQDFDKGFELIISDDCSTDNTQELVDYFIQTHPQGKNIKYYRHEQNLGMSENFYWTLKQCDGKYIAYCEGDDYWTDPDKLKKQIHFLEKQSIYSFAFHRTQLYFQEKQVLESDQNIRFFKEGNEYVEINGFTLANGWQIGMQTLVFRRDLIADLDIEQFGFFRDVHLLTHLLEKANGICLDFFGSVYRIHGNGVHSKSSKYESLKIGFHCFRELSLHYRKDYLKLSFSNYLHELIQLHISEKKYRPAIYYLIELMSLDFNFKIFAFYLRELVFSLWSK